MAELIDLEDFHQTAQKLKQYSKQAQKNHAVIVENVERLKRLYRSRIFQCLVDDLLVFLKLNSS